MVDDAETEDFGWNLISPGMNMKNNGCAREDTELLQCLRDFYYTYTVGQRRNYTYAFKRTEIFRVDEETDALTEEKLYTHWSDFEESDKAELKQFIDEKVFRKVKLSELPETVALVDAT